MEANSITDLPSDLLRKITGKLSLADQIRFRFVCQDFLSLPLQNIHKFPWLVNLLETNTPSQIISWKLYDPIHEKPYTTSLININIGDDKLISYCITSKHGWLFFAINKRDITSFILFSPFTKQIIKLPDFFYPCINERDITFTSDPISKECVFYFLLTYQSGEVKLIHYKHGYRKWRIIPIRGCNNGQIGIMSMAYFKGDLYYYNRYFLLIYTPGYSSYYNYNTQITNEYKYIEYYLVESNGELLLVCGTVHRDRWGIYTFDKESANWAAKTSLPNTALFVASNLISVPAIGEFKHIENKIFYYDSSEEKSKFYNIIDGKTYSCEGTKYEFLVKKHCSPGQYWIDYPPHIIEKFVKLPTQLKVRTVRKRRKMRRTGYMRFILQQN